MSGVQFDITLKNTGSDVEGLSLFSPVQSASQKTNKYSFSTPYLATYPVNTIFTLNDSNGSLELTIQAVSTMAEVIVLLNELNAGTFILGYNDSINGNVFNLLSARNPISLSIDNNDYVTGTFVNVQTIVETFSTNTDIKWVDNTTVLIGTLVDGILYRSIDSGDSYNQVVLPGIVIGFMVFQFSFLDALNGYVLANNNTDSKLFSTADGGASWTLVQDLIGYRFSGLIMFDTLNGFMFGDDGVLNPGVYSTNDGGLTVTPVQLFAGASIDGLFQFVSANIGFVFVLGSGIFLRTIDGGATWLSTIVGSSNGGYALDANNIYIGGNAGSIFYSSNGGASFVNIGIVTANTMYKPHAFNTQHIIIGRQGRQWMRTVDGGLNWVNTSLGPGGSAFLIGFRDQFIGAATDSLFDIYKYS